MNERVMMIFSLSAVLFIAVQLISSSNVIDNLTVIANISVNQTYANANANATTQEKRKQRICILAGPHKTGTSSVQTNLYRWSKPTINFTEWSKPTNNFTNASKAEPLISWIWPVPLKIAEIEHNDTHTWDWAPSKVFYPMMEVLMDAKQHPKKRSLFQKYTPREIIDMYHDTIASYWNEGYDIVFGTEAMDLIVKLPEGPSMIRNLSAHILPETIDGRQVTVVVMYRTPKIKHLVSMWHQNCNRPTDDKFYEWITRTSNTLGPIDALGMVDLLLNETNWNVALINLSGLSEHNWDISNFVACKVLGEKCKDKFLKGLHGSEPVITNVRSGQRDPNVPNKTLDEMDIVLKDFDCNYPHILGEKVGDRLKIYYPGELRTTMRRCEKLGEEGYPQSRDEMRQQIKDIALKHGKLW